MNIDSIQNGIVLDHIKSGKAMEIYNSLKLKDKKCSVYNNNATEEELVTVNIAELYDKINELEALVDRLLIKTVTVELLSSAWVKDSENQYSHVVSIDGVTEYSKIDLQPTAEQLTVFHEKDISFVAENDEGIVTVYCIGQKPANDYSIQATVTEVEIDG